MTWQEALEQAGPPPVRRFGEDNASYQTRALKWVEPVEGLPSNVVTERLERALHVVDSADLGDLIADRQNAPHVGAN